MLVDEFLSYLQYERNYSLLTVEAYRKDLLQFILYLRELDENITFPEDVDADLVRRWIISLMDNKGGREGKY